MAILAGLVVLWLAVPSSLLLRPVALSISGTTVHFTRDTPFGAVYAYWSTEVQSRLGECHAPAAPVLTFYQDGDNLIALEGRAPEPGPVTVRYKLDPALQLCVEPGEQFIKTTTHKVRLAGLIPLRPMRTRWLCVNNGAPCARL